MRKIVAGNWKMNGTSKNLSEIKKISDEFVRSEVEIIVCPPYTLLSAAKELAKTLILAHKTYIQKVQEPSPVK